MDAEAEDMREALANGCKCTYDGTQLVAYDQDCSYHFDVSAEVRVRQTHESRTWPVVCICGSMQFFEQMLDTAEKYTKTGHIVLMPYAVEEPGDQKIMLDAMHRAKIDLAEVVVVVTNFQHYIGESTKAEIQYAVEKTIGIRFAKYGVRHDDPPEPHQELMGA